MSKGDALPLSRPTLSSVKCFWLYKVMSWIHRNWLAAVLAVVATLLGIAVIVLAVLLADNIDKASDETTTPSTPTTPKEPWEEDLRIPSDIVPKNYAVTLRPDFSKGIFNGSVTIDFALTATRSWLPIHIKALQITWQQLIHDQSREIPIRANEEYMPSQFLVLFPESSIPSGQYILNLHFSGNLTNKITGFYQSEYIDKQGKPRNNGLKDGAFILYRVTRRKTK